MFWKTLGPNGTRITVVSWKAGSRKGRSPEFGVLGFWRLLGRKGRPKDVFWKTMKIENGTKKQLFIIGRRWDPLKTVLGSGFEKTLKICEKTIGKSMVSDGIKPLKSIDKQTLFLTSGHSKKQWKIDAKMAPKSHEKWSKIEPGGAQDRFILRFYWFLEKAKKLDFSMRFRGDQRLENKKNGGQTPLRLSRSRLRIKRRTTSRWSHTPKGRRPGELLL